MLLLSEVIEIICLQITLWAHGNLRLGAEAGLEERRAPSLEDNAELVRAQESIIDTSDDLFCDPER